MNWLNWLNLLCIDFVIEGLCVQTLLRMKLNSLFAKFYFDMNVKR